jgi:hypothetical protein
MQSDSALQINGAQRHEIENGARKPDAVFKLNDAADDQSP